MVAVRSAVEPLPLLEDVYIHGRLLADLGKPLRSLFSLSSYQEDSILGKTPT